MSNSVNRKTPSVFDTHCAGAGLLPITPVWSRWYCQWRRFIGDDAKTYPEPPQGDLTGKTAIVSGSNSGIGFQAAKLFAKRGAHVIMACRDPPPHEQHPDAAIKAILKECPNVKAEQLEWWKVDFINFDSIKEFGERWQATGRTCDFLLNNAGSAIGDLVISRDGFELTHQINFLSHTLLTFYILPTMKKAQAPRIVNTCSIFHFGGRLDFSKLQQTKSRGLGGVMNYCDSKLHLLMWTRELQRRLSRSDDYRHVVVHGVHPGFVNSSIWDQPHIQALPRILVWILRFFISKFSVNTQQGSMAMVHAALHPKYGFSAAQLAKGYPHQGESAQIGGKFLLRVNASSTRPEVNDPMATARLWQRVLEDIRAKERGLAQDLPGPAPGLV